MPFVTKVLYEQLFVKLPYPTTPLDGKTILVTGANTGLGLKACRHAVRLNASVLVMGVRNIEAGARAKENILNSVPNARTTIHVRHLDQSSFQSVKSFAKKAKEELERLDILLLNAASLQFGKWENTADGWEPLLQVNSLSPVLLALSLLPKVEQTAASNPESTLRPHITLVTSDSHELVTFKFRKENNILSYMNDSKNFGRSGDSERYGSSKLFNIYTAQKIAQYVTEKRTGVVVNTTNPGYTRTELFRNVSSFSKIMAFFNWIFSSLIGRDVEDGSRNLCHAAFGSGDETHGKYLSACKIAEPGPWARDNENVNKLRNKVWGEIGEVLKKVDPELEPYF